MAMPQTSIEPREMSVVRDCRALMVLLTQVGESVFSTQWYAFQFATTGPGADTVVASRSLVKKLLRIDVSKGKGPRRLRGRIDDIHSILSSVG